jgi:predicted  nucleic acid-binding Zn-ribbon protein
MAEHIDDQMNGILAERRQATSNEVDRLRREYEGVKNNLEEEEQNLAAIDSLIRHVATKAVA